MDTIGADQHIAARGVLMCAVAIKEIGRDAAVILRERAEAAIHMDARLAEPGTDRLKNDALQPAAMNGELRNVVSGVEPARLAPDLLSEPVGVEQLVGADRDRVQAIEQAKLCQFLDGMRQRIDPDAQLANDVGLLEDFAVDPARVQHQRRYQAAHAAAGDDHLHCRYSRTTPVNRAASLPRMAKNAMICRRDGYGLACVQS